MKYKIWDKVNKEYLDLIKYCVNGFGDVMTTKGVVMIEQSCFRIEIEEEDIFEDEPRFLLDMDSICYGCQYYNEDENLNNCNAPEPCIEGNMNGYRMDG